MEKGEVWGGEKRDMGWRKTKQNEPKDPGCSPGGSRVQTSLSNLSKILEELSSR